MTGERIKYLVTGERIKDLVTGERIQDLVTRVWITNDLVTKDGMSK